ncbi:MAG: hypothetical protein GDA66_06875 [Nitrospira sp. CR1.2]|nr:hypothetical protein [Nitrospira sp. CR1.2]
MVVLPGERVPIARLLAFLEYGERMAHGCAQSQAVLAPDAKERRFLTTQARQEAMHAMVFRGAIAWLAPRHLGDVPFLPALEAYRRLLTEALERGDWLESLLAEQVILEGLGEAILTRIECGLEKRQAPFSRLRRVLLHQEEAHHEFGRRVLERAMAEGSREREALRLRSQDYLALTESMVLTLCDLFHTIEEDASAWAADVRTFLPPWLTT